MSNDDPRVDVETETKGVNVGVQDDDPRVAGETETRKDKGVYVGVQDDIQSEDSNCPTDSDYDGLADIWKEMNVAFECCKVLYV